MVIGCFVYDGGTLLGPGIFLPFLDFKIKLFNTNIVFRKYNVGAILEKK